MTTIFKKEESGYFILHDGVKYRVAEVGINKFLLYFRYNAFYELTSEQGHLSEGIEIPSDCFEIRSVSEEFVSASPTGINITKTYFKL